MFKITPIQDKAEQRDICERVGVVFRPEAFAYQMFDIESGALMGMAQFEIGETGYIYDLKEVPGRDDFEAMFILGRATMNFIDLCGKHTCYARKSAGDERLLKCIGFKEIEGADLFADMTGMFDGKCDGHTVTEKTTAI